MVQVTLQQQFHGTALLTILHLRRLAKSNDIDAGFAAARDLRMIDDDQEAFMRDCLAFDEELSGAGHGSAASNGSPALELSPQLVQRLQACILSINSADPA